MYAAIALVFLLVGIWIGKGYPLPHKQIKDVTVTAEPTKEEKDAEQKIKEQWKNMLDFQGGK